MKAILNDKILDWKEVRLSPQNRGFLYGDGFFETIAIIRGKPRFLNRHLERLKNGAKKLKLDVQDILNVDKIRKNIENLQKANDLPENAKLKLTIWRNTDGLYTPVDGNTHYLMTIEKSALDKVSVIKSAGVSDETVNYPSTISRFKTISAMKYVLAGIEKNDRGFDEIIILDHRGYVSEALSSNLFWKKNSSYFSAPLSTGCVEGMMRNWLMNELKQNGLLVEEKLVKVTGLLDSDSIFTTNAMGISHIQSIGSKTFQIDPVSQGIIESIS